LAFWHLLLLYWGLYIGFAALAVSSDYIDGGLDEGVKKIRLKDPGA